MAERLLTAETKFIYNIVDLFANTRGNTGAIVVGDFSKKCPLLKTGECQYKHAPIPNCEACDDSKLTFSYVEDLIKQKLENIYIETKDLQMEIVTSKGRNYKTRERGSLTLTQGGPNGEMVAKIKPLDFLKE